MPIYEYQCEKCEHQFETMQKISEKPLKKCPECGKSALTKLVSAAAFRLKGGGWYETDFKSGNKKNLASSDKSGGDKSGSDKSATDKSGGSDSQKSKGSSSDAGKSKKDGASGKSGKGKSASSSGSGA